MDSLFDGRVSELSVLELCSVEDEAFDSEELDSFVSEELDDSDSEDLDFSGALKSILGSLST
ncbi:hypothetical protein SORDD24_01858 [Streptococcus oralis]|uniref:Uncharacterized protein n=1 Tax=Streptococcus oralis TaxID=1303 RepID=A0A139QLB6_STROR|nr:hypothetical protein SORDD24_01858 [Streptococcus oralis]